MLLTSLIAQKTSASSLVDRLFYQDTGRMVVSAVFGLALAFMFQKACKGRKCLIIQAPPTDNLETVHRTKDQCYIYTPRYVQCNIDTKTNTDSSNASQ